MLRVRHTTKATIRKWEQAFATFVSRGLLILPNVKTEVTIITICKDIYATEICCCIEVFKRSKGVQSILTVGVHELFLGNRKLGQVP